MIRPPATANIDRRPLLMGSLESAREGYARELLDERIAVQLETIALLKERVTTQEQIIALYQRLRGDRSS